MEKVDVENSRFYEMMFIGSEPLKGGKYGILKTPQTDGKSLEDICNLHKVTLAKRLGSKLRNVKEYVISTGLDMKALEKGEIKYISYARVEDGLVFLNNMVKCSMFFEKPATLQRKSYGVKDVAGILPVVDGYYAVFLNESDGNKIGLKRLKIYKNNLGVLGLITWYDLDQFKQSKCVDRSTGKKFSYKSIIWSV